VVDIAEEVAVGWNAYGRFPSLLLGILKLYSHYRFRPMRRNPSPPFLCLLFKIYFLCIILLIKINFNIICKINF